MVNSLDYHPCSSRLTSRIHLSYFCKLRSALSLFKMLVEFSLIFYIPPCVGNISNLWSSSSYKMHWFEVFLLIPLPTQNSPPISCHQALGRRILLILSGSIVSKTCFPEQQKGVKKTDFIYQNLVRKYESEAKIVRREKSATSSE